MLSHMNVPTPQGPIRVQIAGQRLSVTFPQGTVLVLGSGETEQRRPGPAKLDFATRLNIPDTVLIP